MKAFSLIFYRIKNKKKFLSIFFSIKDSLETLLDTTEEYKKLKKERLKLMKTVNENSRIIFSYLTKLQKKFPSLDGLEDFKKEIQEIQINKEQDKDFFHNFKEKEELDLELIKEELKKIEEDLLKLNLD